MHTALCGSLPWAPDRHCPLAAILSWQGSPSHHQSVWKPAPAADFGHAAAVRELLQASPDIAAMINVRGDEGLTALMLAAKNGHAAVMRLLLRVSSCRLDVQDNHGYTALTFAAACGRPQIIRQLLAALHLSRRPSALLHQDRWGCTPLHRAAMQGGTETVDMLLWASGGLAALTMRDADGNIPLHQAASAGHADVVAQLLRAKPSVNSQNYESCTPLMLAALKNRVEVVEFLLRVPACRLDARTRGDQTALDLAVANRHSQVAALLRDAHAPRGAQSKLVRMPCWCNRVCHPVLRWRDLLRSPTQLRLT